jgi:hypothetical protein
MSLRNADPKHDQKSGLMRVSSLRAMAHTPVPLAHSKAMFSRSERVKLRRFGVGAEGARCVGGQSHQIPRPVKTCRPGRKGKPEMCGLVQHPAHPQRHRIHHAAGSRAANMDVFPSDATGIALSRPVDCNAVADAVEPAQALDVEMNQPP